jgi:N-acetylglucosamine kinase
VIGIDGGGTKTVAVVADRAGKALGRGHGGPSSISAMTPSDAFASVRTACEGALAEASAATDDVAAVCAGVAGWSVAGKRDTFASLLNAHFPSARVVVEPDYAVALAGALGGEPGIVVIAGTGSIAYGESGAGQSMRTGGYGYLIDDWGSGYGVGRDAIACVLKAEDGIMPPTSLREAVLAATGLSSPADLAAAVYDGRVVRTDIAALSRVVAAQADGGDDVSIAILARAGKALAGLVSPIVRRVFAGDPAVCLATVGSLWEAGPWVVNHFRLSLSGLEARLQFVLPQNPPEQGAVLRALAALRAP